MDISTITTFLANPSGWAFMLLLALVAERLVKGGYLGVRLGKKTLADYSTQEGRDASSVKILMDLSTRMRDLETHFNHETTEQYRTMIRGQEETLETLRRIERDGIRLKA